LNIRFACPACDAPGYAEQPADAEWRCPSCDHVVALAPAPAGQPLACCAACGNRELYRKKDFPHGLGMAILVLALVATVVTYWLYHQWLTWGILIGTALFDGLLYLWVGDVVVCYRCNAHHRGYPVNAEHGPHELTVAERYRQERIRREQMRFGRERPAGAEEQRSRDARG
jgi:hypothetical protein